MPIHFSTSEDELIWNTSRNDAYSVNIDASISSEAREFSLGAFISNSSGEFVVARTS